MRLLLASKSPRRRQLLGAIDIAVEPVDIDADETLDAGVPVEQMAEQIAQRKAACFDAARLVAGDVLVTADTIVALGGRKLGKPRSREEAVAMLRTLSGRSHTVYTGVCLVGGSRSVSFTEATQVYFRELTDAEITHYVDGYKPFDKAGAYGIQEWIGMIGISRIEGDYYNVMGLPVARLYSMLKLHFGLQ